MSFAFTYFLAVFSCWLLIPLLIKYSDQLKLLDYPSEERKSHKEAISRAGGIGIVLSTAIALQTSFLDTSAYTPLYLAAFIIILFGIADDTRPLSAKWKLVGQTIAAAVAMLNGVLLTDLPFLGSSAPEWLSYFLTFFFIIGVTNAVNLTDGLDGLAAGSTLLSLALIALLAYAANNLELVIIAIAIMGGISGFLRYNTHPAQLFMGDTGSQFIGFMAACLAILATQLDGVEIYNTALPILILGLPILDTMYVMFIRFINDRPLFSADRNHLHHRLIRLNFPHHEAVALIYVVQISLMALAYGLRYSDDVIVLSAYVLFGLATLSSIVLAKHFGWQRKLQRKELRANPEAERRNPVYRRIGESFDLIAQVLSASVLFILCLALVLLLQQDFFDRTLGMISALTTVFALFYYAVHRNKTSDRLLRFTTGLAITICMYATSVATQNSPAHYFLDASLLGVIAFLVVSVRVTRGYLDMFNTQDLLIFMLLLLLPILPIDKSSVYLAIRIAIVVYVVEYLVVINRPMRKLINIGSIFCLFTASVILLQ